MNVEAGAAVVGVKQQGAVQWKGRDSQGGAGMELRQACRLKRCTTRELLVKFCLGRYEDCSPESVLRIMRDCFKEAVGEGQYMILVKEEFSAVKPSFYRRFSASHEELLSPRRDLVLF